MLEYRLFFKVSDNLFNNLNPLSFLPEILYAEQIWKEQRQQLKQAMGTQDPAAIAAAIKTFEQHKVPDDKGLVKKAKDLQAFLIVSNGTSKYITYFIVGGSGASLIFI